MNVPVVDAADADGLKLNVPALDAMDCDEGLKLNAGADVDENGLGM